MAYNVFMKTDIKRVIPVTIIILIILISAILIILEFKGSGTGSSDNQEDCANYGRYDHLTDCRPDRSSEYEQYRQQQYDDFINTR